MTCSEQHHQAPVSPVPHKQRAKPSWLTTSVALIIALGALACGRTSSNTSDTSATGAASTTAVANQNAAGRANGASATSGSVPATLSAVGGFGEGLYDAIKAGNWTKAASITDSLNTAVPALTSSGDAATYQSQLTALLDTLKRTVPAHQQRAALKAANRVTYLEAKMTAQYRPTTPAEVLLLDYYGRELEIWSVEKNEAQLAQTATDIQNTWNGLRPAIQARGRGDQATHTDSLVTMLSAARTPPEYARLAKPFLDEVDELEKVFTKQ